MQQNFYLALLFCEIDPQQRFLSNKTNPLATSPKIKWNYTTSSKSIRYVRFSLENHIFQVQIWKNIRKKNFPSSI